METQPTVETKGSVETNANGVGSRDWLDDLMHTWGLLVRDLKREEEKAREKKDWAKLIQTNIKRETIEACIHGVTSAKSRSSSTKISGADAPKKP